MRRFDDVWMDTNYTFYANPITRVRSYPTTYTIAPEFNLPPDDSYTDRLLPLLNNEPTAIDVVMFRITDSRPATALINAVGRKVPVRLYAEPGEYRNAARLDDSVQHRPHVHGRRAHQDACALRTEPSENRPAGRTEDDRVRDIQLVDGIGRQSARSELLHDQGLVLRILPEPVRMEME